MTTSAPDLDFGNGKQETVDTVAQPCWGFHCQAIPAAATRVIDRGDRVWLRAGVRSWRREWPDDPSVRYHESWLLLTHGPVYCDVAHDLLGARDAKLLDLLVVDGVWAFLPDMAAGEEPLAPEDAMMLMRAGWLIWPPKQRREALASLRETEERELAVTS